MGKRRRQPLQPSQIQLVVLVTPQPRQSRQLSISWGAKRWHRRHNPPEKYRSLEPHLRQGGGVNGPPGMHWWQNASRAVATGRSPQLGQVRGALTPEEGFGYDRALG
jgi:hypothetical protein